VACDDLATVQRKRPGMTVGTAAFPMTVRSGLKERHGQRHLFSVLYGLL